MYLDKFEPKGIFKFFEEISAIPRGSGNEKAACDYLLAFAKERGLFARQDEALNVIIKKDGTKGMEGAPAVIIQGHIDMVCEKNEGTAHDFEKDPIKLIVEGDTIKADGTTLGADNGVAVAYALALLDAADIAHPPLEVLLTSGEEVGLLGAGKIDGSLFSGKVLLNLDSSAEGVFTVSCAGGARADIELAAEYEPLPASHTVKLLKVKGLKGGHSGTDISKERANANRILGRALKTLCDRFDARFAGIKGGSKDNAIPREASAFIAFDAAKAGDVAACLTELARVFQNEYRLSDEGLEFFAEDCKADDCKAVFSKAFGERVCAVLLLLPYGVSAYSLVFDGLPETSLNIGVIDSSQEACVKITASLRSSVGTKKEMMADQIGCLAALAGAKVSFRGAYPAWEYNAASSVRETAAKVYRELFGKEATIKATHGGLECGILGEKIAGVDILSFGPNVFDLHTPQERMEISSFKRVWEYLQKLLAELGRAA
ncbi:MAG: aminoacyl-histidine dipeptidase [Spirochaetes bacterium]|nr:aminoacyl-histidine dipeptidase [Spirochaetota bacterium]